MTIVVAQTIGNLACSPATLGMAIEGIVPWFGGFERRQAATPLGEGIPFTGEWDFKSLTDTLNGVGLLVGGRAAWASLVANVLKQGGGFIDLVTRTDAEREAEHAKDDKATIREEEARERKEQQAAMTPEEKAEAKAEKKARADERRAKERAKAAEIRARGRQMRFGRVNPVERGRSICLFGHQAPLHRIVSNTRKNRFVANHSLPPLPFRHFFAPKSSRCPQRDSPCSTLK